MSDQSACALCREPRHKSSLYSWVCYQSFETEKSPSRSQTITISNLDHTRSAKDISFYFWASIPIGGALFIALWMTAVFSRYLLSIHQFVFWMLGYLAIVTPITVIGNLFIFYKSPTPADTLKKPRGLWLGVFKGLLIAIAVPVLLYLLFFLACGAVMAVIFIS